MKSETKAIWFVLSDASISKQFQDIELEIPKEQEGAIAEQARMSNYSMSHNANMKKGHQVVLKVERA